MKTSKKRLIAGLVAITCCCSVCEIPAINNGVSVINTVSAAGGSDTTVTVEDEEVPEETEEEDLTSSVTVKPIDSASWTNADGYSYAIADVTVTKVASDGTSTVTTDRVVAITGYTGSSLTLVAHNNAAMPEGLKLSLSKAGVDLSGVDTTYSTAIADSALKDNAVIKSIDMADIEYLGKECFSGCKGLMTVEIPETVKAVGAGVFKGSGVSTLFVNNKMRDIPDEFCYSSSLSQITFANPSAVRTIGKSAFASTKLTQYPLVDMGSSVEIGYSAFHSCDNITELTLGSKVKSIGNNAFSSMKNLVSVDIGSAKTIGSNAFESCSSLKTVVLNDAITSIGNAAFSLCTGLETFPKLPESIVDTTDAVAGLGKEVFKGCSALTSFTFSDSVANIPAGFFSGCTSLKSVTFGKGIANIGDNAFKDCAKLSSVAHENTIRDIGSNAFSNCRSLPYIIANKCKTIGAKAYSGCVSIREVSLDADKCGEAVFENCSGIKTATLAASIAENLPKDMFRNCSSLEGFVNTNFTNVQVISEGAFMYCTSLKEVDFPSAIQILPNSFAGCSSLERITKEGDLRIENYGKNCFNGCTSLKQNINSTVKIVGENAFKGSNIGDVILRGAINGSLDIGVDAFAECKSLKGVSIQIPESTKFTVASGTFRDCPAITNVQYGGTEFSESMFENCSGIETVVAKNIVSAGDRAFAGCTSLSTIIMPESGVFKTLGAYAFKDCESLTQTYTDGGTLVSNGTFRGCTSLTNAKLGMLTDEIFMDCVNLEAVEGIAKGIEHIPDYAFYGCKSITSLDFLPRLDYPSLGKSCFENSGLSGALTIVDDVDGGARRKDIAFNKKYTIGDRAFAGCTKITSVDIVYHTISESAFEGCTGIGKAKLEVCVIGDNAFKGCTNLQAVEAIQNSNPYGLTWIGAGAFQDCNFLREFVLEESKLANTVATIGRRCKIGEKALGYVGDLPVNNFLLVGDTTIGVVPNSGGIEIHSGLYEYAKANGLMFQDLDTYDEDSRELEKLLVGDVNLDGVVSVADAIAMQRWLTRQEVNIYAKNADVNEDGVVNVFDNILIKRIIMNDGQLPEIPEQPVVTTTVVEEPKETTTTTVTNATAKK